MANRDEENIELESQPLNAEKKTEILAPKNDKKEKIRPIGLTKEELIKYAKDPFWCKLRKILFALFWFLWLSMLVGAFLIIHYVPTCPAISRLKWYQKEPVGQINFELFNYKFDMVSNNAKSFMNVFQTKTLLLPNLFKSTQKNGDQGDEIVDHFELNPNFGSKESLSKMLKNLKVEHQSSIIMDFNAAVTSRRHEWFNSFVNRKSKYRDYYLVDNNFTSYLNYDSEKTTDGKYVITKLGKPVLNLLNPDVKAEFKKIFEKWGRLNIKGFRLLGGPYLLEDPVTKRKAIKSAELNRKLIKEWSKEFKHAVSDGVLILQLDDNDAEDYASYFGTQNEPAADVVVNKVLTRLDTSNSTSDIKTKLNSYINSTKRWNDELMNIGPWTGWLVDDPNETRNKDDLIVCFSNILAYILPRGMPITRLSFNLLHIGVPSAFHETLKDKFNNPEIYGTFDNARIFAKLSNLRKDYSDAIMLGKTEFVEAKINDQPTDDVFAMIRTNEKQGLILIANLKNLSKNITLDIDFNKYPRTATVKASCKIKEGNLYGEIINLDKPINLKLNETLVATFDMIF